MPTPSEHTTISFEGLSPQAAEKLAAGLAKGAGASTREIFANLKDIKAMKLEDVDKVTRLMGAAVRAHGNCGNGCAG